MSASAKQKTDADWNAAMNIAATGAAVTRLEDASHESVKAAAL